MSKIKIKNFGPIKEGMLDNDGWIDIKKVTVFIGNQGSGKSTVAKAISILSWLEKSLNRGDTDKGKISFATFKEFFEYQKIHNYFSKTTYIEFIGEKYHIIYDITMEYPIIKEVEVDTYIVPKIMYIPAERNFLSTISDAYNVKGLPDNVFTFAEELRRAQNELNGKKLSLPISDLKYQYDEARDESYVFGKGYKINLLEASSGLQSFIPLYLVSRNLSMAITDDEKTLRKNLSVTQSMRMDKEIADLMLDKKVAKTLDRDQEIEKIRARYYNKCFFNVVEEPEQNLFPSSQWEMLKSILEYNNISEGNKLIMTTHSPYLINYLTLAVKADNIYKLLIEKKYKLSEPEYSKTNEIVPMSSTVNSDDLVIYELDEKNGIIKKLSEYKGLPSDENFLNRSIEDSNELFAQLLEIQQGL
jgi:predicted ATPase